MKHILFFLGLALIFYYGCQALQTGCLFGAAMKLAQSLIGG
jgi:hypothetical protein